MIASGEVPPEVREGLRKGRRLCLWTLFWLGGISVLMYLVMGQSQAMKTAFIEDVLSLVPSITFLIAASLEDKPASRRFPFGFKRFNSIAFLISATALLSIGTFMAYEAVMALVMMEHPSIGAIRLFGTEVWLGWVMIGVLMYSAIPPIILGRKKMPVAEKIEDKVLFTDAQTQKADWQTALAGIVGVTGIGFGLWWADAVAALFISLSILRDGWSNIKKSTAELADGAPRDLEGGDLDRDAQDVAAKLANAFPLSDVRMRESGRYMLAEIVGPDAVGEVDLSRFRPEHRPWRLAEVAMVLKPRNARPGEQADRPSVRPAASSLRS
ncbi:cation diffusion facilitator family transporter [Allopontixanthobacter sp.]|uniref:cation diffusion facilitator family transporter n=1 Tax=Allopontixanthobacter sp. TaxID=2906452 RepID=UPI002AB9A8E2|nr:cation diffusion facilitator family transporter [Allopontixanthobacter sp.]MDZ4306673.1 cation diffusion facilitator family transporter [Allopontixanthobacter sp.]